jgi:hypothetical protein
MKRLFNILKPTIRKAVRQVLLALQASSALSICAADGVKKPIIAKPATILSLSVSPSRAILQGPYGEARLLVDARNSAGAITDVSSKVRFECVDPTIASVDESGILRARRDGRTKIKIMLGKFTASVPIQVQGVAKAAPPRFTTDVIPVLTKAGCTTGACHGSGSGKGGFKLSLLGYDPDSDYQAIVYGGLGRRIMKSQPEASLLLRKPTLAAAHKGGLRFRADSPEYKLLADWIGGGMPGPTSKEPHVVKLQVTPAVRTMGLGQSQRFAVRGYFSDGVVRDVTGETVFTASDESVAKVSSDGEATTTGRGEGAVLIRYQDLVATARVVSPFSAPQVHAASVSGTGKIDNLVNQKLAALGLRPSSRCSDSDFLRRAFLDVIGILPSPDEARAFLADKDLAKRSKLIDSLLDRGEYVDFWALKWGDLLRSNRRVLSDKGLVSFGSWIRDSVAENKPWDQFVREMLLARGGTYEVGPANFYRTATTPETLAETTSQAFLGVRIQCTRCHNHPYEKWKQNQYYEMAAFFARVREKKGKGSAEQTVFLNKEGEVKHPKTQKEVLPCALDAPPIQADFRGDRREALADWITSARNPFFGKIIVNRIWKHYMGRGLVEPVDDLRVTNPASNEPLFNFLAQDLAAHGYDLKYLMRTIMLSDAYQRSSEPANGNDRDIKYLSHYAFKRLGAEQLSDAISAATGVPEKFTGYPSGLHAAQLPDTGVPNYLLDLFGRPARNITCECERMDQPNLGQILHLINNSDINGRIAAKNGRVATLIDAKVPDQKLVEELYLSTFSRYPTADETRRAVLNLTKAKNRQPAAEDLLWVLLNEKEFLFNH